MSKLPLLVFGLVLLGPLGCRPKIGDKCETSVDCSVQGDRLCDDTQPGGYCTIFNCEPDGCPVDESQCVAFKVVLDPACGPAINATTVPRFERSFCMAPCSDDSDCRSSEGYACVDPRDRNAEVIDSDPDSLKVCMVVVTPETGGLVQTELDPYDGGPGTALYPPGFVPGVCEPADAGFDVTPYDGSGSGAGGHGGAAQSGSASGAGGA